ncbi:MAG TPA: hypothetical protein VLV32_07105 [Burkholderiales bacterium]|nr:hypothetical protein [Burkholderiales bacterium]
METAIQYCDAVAKQMSRLSQYIGTLLIALSLVLASGCSVYMAAHQPEKKDTTLLVRGTPRSLLLTEFGQPASTEMRDGKRIDYFTFVQGSTSDTAKNSRAIFYGAADLLTLGLFEVVSTPTELALGGDKITYEVTYDSDDKVEKVVQIGKETSPKPAEQSPKAPSGDSEGSK